MSKTKLNKPDDKRILYAIGDEMGFVLSEKNAYEYYGRKKWDESRVWISLDEIKKLAALAEVPNV